MINKTLVAALMALAGSAAQAQSCPCGAGTQVTDAALTALLGGHMICGSVGTEVWQEFHNGGAAGALLDYKAGPSDPVDPSETVGTYSVSGSGANSVVAYSYTGGSTYRYSVCQTGGNYTMCGAAFGGRDITGVRIGGSGLQSCSGVASIPASITPVAPAIRTPAR